MGSPNHAGIDEFKGGGAAFKFPVAGSLFWLSVGGILYTYFGYPLLVTLLARRKPQPGGYPSHIPGVTLLIAAYNEEAVIREKIENCLQLDYPKERLQILIVTDGSDDRTPRIVQEFRGDGVELLHQPERGGKTAAINRAISAVRGEVLVFSDANNFYPSDTLQHLVAPFSDPAVGAVSGIKVIQQEDGTLGESEGLYWKYESYIKQQESRLGSCTSVAGEILAVRREAYLAPPDDVVNDDFYIAMQVIRQGYRLVYAPEARSYERVSASAQDEITRRRRIISGRYQAISLAQRWLPFDRPLLVWQIVSHKFLRPLVPFGMIGAALGNLAAVLWPAQGQPKTQSLVKRALYLARPVGQILLALQILFYSLAWLGGRLESHKSPNKLGKLLYLPTFLVNSNWAALQGFIHFLQGRRTHLWERIPRR